MDRREFVRLLAAAPLLPALQNRSGLPALRVVSKYAPAAAPGMPGPYPGRVVAVTSAKSVDITTGAANDEAVREMMARGMRALTGAGTVADAWRRFFEPADRVGIKNRGGYPHCIPPMRLSRRSSQLTGIIPFRRFCLRASRTRWTSGYAAHLPERRRSRRSAPTERRQQRLRSGYLPEADLFGEDDTRVQHDAAGSQRPRDHQHPEHEGPWCRRHRRLKNTPTAASRTSRGRTRTAVAHVFRRRHARRDQPLRSRTVPRYGRPARRVARRSVRADHEIRLLSETIAFGTDPVAIDRLLLDIIDKSAKRTAR